MSADPTPTEVFEDVDPDPDAILADCGVETPEDLIAGEGDHDAIPDAEIDADDVTAAELFADLQSPETGATTDPEDRPGADHETDGADHATESDPVPVDDLEFEFVGDSDVTVRADGDVIESTAADLSALTASDPTAVETGDDEGTDTAACTDRDRSVDATAAADATDATDAADGDPSEPPAVRSGPSTDLELVGPAPTPTRVANDAFGRADDH